MKILFYDTKKFELNYLLERLPKNIEAYFFKNLLNESTYVDEKYIDSSALSVFVSSTLNKEVLSKFKNLKFIFLRSVGYSRQQQCHAVRPVDQSIYGFPSCLSHEAFPQGCPTCTRGGSRSSA